MTTQYGSFPDELEFFDTPVGFSPFDRIMRRIGARMSPDPGSLTYLLGDPVGGHQHDGVDSRLVSGMDEVKELLIEVLDAVHALTATLTGGM
jgi:hypothetical protein